VEKFVSIATAVTYPLAKSQKNHRRHYALGYQCNDFDYWFALLLPGGKCGRRCFVSAACVFG
jgi:hypothetical protein